MDGSNDLRPSHKDIFQDLRIKKEENPKEFPLLLKAIERVWNCDEPDDVLASVNLKYAKGFSPELLLKILVLRRFLGDNLTRESYCLVILYDSPSLFPYS